jgi:hypothetical protein
LTGTTTRWIQQQDDAGQQCHELPLFIHTFPRD